MALADPDSIMLQAAKDSRPRRHYSVATFNSTAGAGTGSSS
jgi:hypothetical protein